MLNLHLPNRDRRRNGVTTLKFACTHCRIGFIATIGTGRTAAYNQNHPSAASDWPRTTC